MSEEVKRNYSDLMEDISEIMGNLPNITKDEKEYNILLNVCLYFLNSLMMLPPLVVRKINAVTIEQLKEFEKQVESGGKIEIKFKEDLGDKTIEDILNGKMD